MRDHFQAVLGTMLIVQAVCVAAALGAGNVHPSDEVNGIRLVEPTAVDTHSMFDTSATGVSRLSLTHDRSATADVMNLPAEPIPTPPAFAMGMTVLLAMMGIKVGRRLRLRLL